MGHEQWDPLVQEKRGTMLRQSSTVTEHKLPVRRSLKLMERAGLGLGLSVTTAGLACPKPPHYVWKVTHAGAGQDECNQLAEHSITHCQFEDRQQQAELWILSVALKGCQRWEGGPAACTGSHRERNAYLEHILLGREGEVPARDLQSDVGHGRKLVAVNHRLAVAKEGEGLAHAIQAIDDLLDCGMVGKRHLHACRKLVNQRLTKQEIHKSRRQ